MCRRLLAYLARLSLLALAARAVGAVSSRRYLLDCLLLLLLHEALPEGVLCLMLLLRDGVEDLSRNFVTCNFCNYLSPNSLSIRN